MAKTTQNPPEIDAWDSLSPQLDAALSSLGSKDRRVVVLRFLQGKSLTEVASIVGISHDAARQRLHRAIERMRALLQARGVTVAPAAIGPILAAHAVGAAPPHLASAIVCAVTSGTAAAAGSTSILTKGAVWAMASFKTKVAIVAAAAVVVVGGGTAAVVKFAHSSDGELLTVPQNQAASLNQPIDQVYGLGHGEVVKLVAPPFIGERDSFAKRSLGRKTSGPLPPDYALVMEWDGSKSKLRSVEVGPVSLRTAVWGATGVDRWDLEDPSEILEASIPGDWVYRKGYSRDEFMSGIAKIASAKLGRPIEFVKKPSTRQVIVIRASAGPTTATATPLPGERPWTQHGTVEDLSAQLSGAADRQVVDETGRPRVKVSWRIEQFRSLDELLNQVSKQTSLRISAETRNVDIWSIVDQSAVPPADWRSQFQKTYGLADGEALKHIAPPYGPERRAWWNATRAEHDYDLRPGWTLMFDFDGTPKYQTSVSPGSLDMGLRACFGDWNDAGWFGNIDETVPVGMNLGGDWVARVGATTEQKMAALGPILSKHLGRPVHFQKRRASQDVIVARGAYAPPVAGSTIDISPEPSAAATIPPPARTTLDRLLKDMGWSVQVPVIDETSTPDILVSYRVNGPYTKQVESVLTSVARQTGLSFSREQRDRDVWSLVPGN